MATDNSQLIEQRLPDNTSEKITPADVRAVAHALDQQVPNQRRGGPFCVIFETHAQAVAANRADNASLDQLDPLLLCVGCLARVDLHPDQNGQWLVLGYEARANVASGLRVHLDGNFSQAAGAAVPVKWYKLGSQEAQEANVPLLDPARNYLQDFVVRAVYGGLSYPFFSRNGGAHPAPPDFTGDSNWGPVAPQPAATTFHQLYPLDYAQYLLRTAPAGLRAPVLYAVPGKWNGGAATRTVEVAGGVSGFAAFGTLAEGSTRTPVLVDVAAGSYVPVGHFADLLGEPADHPGLQAIFTYLANADASLRAQLFGRNRGAWAAGTAYQQYDFVIFDNKQYYATQAFTSGASFQAANWTASPYAQPSNLPFASTSAAGLVRVGPGLRVAGSNGVLRNEALFYTRDTVYAPYDGSVEASVAFGFTCAVNGHPQVSINTSAAQTGDVLAVRNLGAASTQLNASGATLDGLPSLALEPQGWLVLKYEAGNLVTVQRGSLGVPATGGGTGGLTTTELQLYTPDANGRITVLALSAPLTLTHAEALAARNVAGLHYQVNAYDAANSAWLPGAERTSLAEAQADMAALTAGQYAAGAELLCRVLPVDSTKAARALLTVSANRSLSTFGNRTALRLSGSLVYSSFAAAYEARQGGNTATSWKDLSGKGRDLSIAAGAYTLTTDATSRTVYRNNDFSSAWALPSLSATASDYTVYALVRLADNAPGFLLDSINNNNANRLILPINAGDGFVYANGWSGPANAVAAGALVVLTWRLNSAPGAAAVLHNNSLFASGNYTAVPLTGNTYFGRRADNASLVVNGDLHAFYVSLGNDSDDVVDATNKYLLAL